MRFIEIPALITEDIEDPSIVEITEPITVSISGTTMTIDGGSKVSGEASVTLTGDVTVNAFTLQNVKQPSIHKISLKTGRKGNFTYVPNITVTASSVSTTTKTGSDFEILLITTTGGETYVDFDMADYVSPALYTSNALTGFDISELTSTYGATAKLYKPDGTLLTTVTSATTGNGVNFGYTESTPGDVTYTLEVEDDLGRTSRYDLPRKWISYAMETNSTPGFEKLELAGNEYTSTTIVPNISPSSKAKVFRTNNHGYMGINFKIQGRNSTNDAWTDIANADEDDEVLAFGDYLYHRVWVKPTAKATTTVSSSNVVTLTLSNLTEENVTTSFTGADPFDINESTNTYVFEETTKIGTFPFTVTLGTETYTNAVTVTTEGTAYDYVTLAFANPTLSLTTSNVTISSAKLYRDDVLFHTYGTESNVVLRSDQTGTYQAIVNDVYYSNRVTPDFTTTRSVSAPQLEFDGYNRLNLSNSTPTSTTLGLPDGTTRDLTTQSNVYIYETGTYTANVQTSDTFAYLSNVVTSQPSQNSADVGPTFTFDGYNRLNLSNLTQTSSTLKYGSKTYDTNTASNVYVTDTGEYILEAKDANTFVMSNVYVGAVSQHPSDVVPTLTFDGYNKLTIENDGNGDTGMKNVTISGGPWNTLTFKPDDNAQKGKFQWDLWSSTANYQIGNKHNLEYVPGYGWYVLNQDGTGFGDVTPTSATSGTYLDGNGVSQTFSTNLASSSGGVLSIAHTAGTMTVNESDFFEGGIFPPKVGSLESVTIKKDGVAFATTTSDTVYIRDTGTYTAEVKGSGAYAIELSKVVTGSVIPNVVFPSSSNQALVSTDGSVKWPSANDNIDGQTALDASGTTLAIGTIDGNGAIYVFEKTNGVWTQVQKMTANSPASSTFFGGAISISGDIIVTCTYGPNNSDGFVYVFEKTNGVWPSTETVKMDPQYERLTGIDIYGTTIVATERHETNRGRFYIFEKTNGLWPSNYTSRIDTGTGYFTWCSAMYGDNLAIMHVRAGTTYSYVLFYERDVSGQWNYLETKGTSEGQQTGSAGGSFGRVMSMYDTTVAITGLYDDSNKGNVYVYKKSNGTWVFDEKISNHGITNERFGMSLKLISETKLLIGSYGHAYIYEDIGGTWTETFKFEGADNTDFGKYSTLSSDGNTAFISDTSYNSNQGAVYVYEKGPAGPNITYDGKNKLTLNQLNYEDTATVTVPNESTYNLGTAKTIYVKDTGEYVFKISGTDKYIESNVYVSSVDLVGAPTKPIDFDGYNKLTLIDAGSNVSANVTYFSNTYELGSANVLYINGAGTYDLEMSGSNVFALSSNVVSTVDSNPTGTYNTIFNIDGLNSSGKLGASHVGYPISFNAAGTRVVIGEYNIDKAHIYDKVEGSWTLSQTWTKSNGFGKSCAMSDDGNVVVVVENAGTNKLSLFVYENGSWVTKQNQISISGSRDTFGSGLFMSGDGLYLLATDYSYEGSGGNGRNKIYDLSEYSFLERLNFGFSTTAYSWHGDIDRYGNRAIWDDDAADYWRVYKRSGATWSQSTTIAPSNTSGRGPASCDENMVRVALSDTGNSSAGVTIWYRNPSGDTFALEKTITVDNSGCNISMNYAGDRLMITDKTAGDIEIWTRSGTTWTKQKTINPPTFGTLVNFAHTANKSDGYTLAITDETYDSNKGRVYIYSDPITPSLTFDNYNKLSIENLTPTSTTLRFGSNTYDIGTASNVYIEDAGTYKVATGDANTFALVSNVVGAIATDKFDPLDPNSVYSILGTAFTPSTTSDTQSTTSLSNDGTRVLVDNETGYFIQVYEYSSGSWTQLGSDINYGTSSTSSRISGDGNRVCVGISSSNQVKVYEYSSGSWSQIGTTITGSNGFGTDTSLNYDGTRLMVGASGDYNTRGNQTVWQESGGNWTQLGSTLYCNHNSYPHSLCGGNVDINNDGTVVCAGGYKGHSQDKGCLHVWKYNGSSWTQSFFSEGGNDHHSNYCRLSGDGKVVMYSHDRWNEPRGRVNFYENTSGASWSQIGGYLEDKKLGDLSNDGKTVVVGKSDASIDSQVYRFDGSAWVQLGSNLEHTSTTLSISSDGSTVAIGNSTSGANKVSVYKGTTPSPSLTYDTSNKLSIENLTPTSTTLTDPNGSSFDIGTASNVYIRDSGKYSIASKDANTFVLASNTVTGTPTGTTYVYDSNTFTTPSQTYDTTKTITVKNVPSTLIDVAGKIYKGSTAYPIHATTSSSNVIIKNTGSYVSVFTTATQAFLTNAIGVTTQPTTTSDDTTIEDEGFIPGSTAVPDETTTDAPSVTLDATDTTVTDPTLDLDFTTTLPRTLKRYNGVTNSSIGARFNRHETNKKRIEKRISIPSSFSAELTANNASSPTTLTVTVANSKFVINGDETPTLGFIRGETYTFDQSDASNSGHPLVLATSADGTQYTTGWTASGTPGTDGSHAFIVPYDVPDTIYYKCTNHANMGGEINTTFGNVFSLGDFTVAANTHVSGEYTLATNYDGTTSNLYVNGDLITQTTPSPAIVRV